MKWSQSAYQLLNRLNRPPAKPLHVSWVLPHTIALGRLPRHKDSASLATAGIRVVLSLCSEAEGPLPESVKDQFNCHRMMLPDSRYAESLEPRALSQAAFFVHQAVQAGQPIYVHCLAGVERSPTVCLAYLCQYRQVPLGQALRWVQQVHPAAHPTEAQLRVIQKVVQTGAPKKIA